MPRRQSDSKICVVAWAHGTSGLFGDCAPSHKKNLHEGFSTPFPLALQGYVTVAPDYAGLGVYTTADGQEIVHQYIASPSHANDVIYAVQAAQSAFSQLSSQFVVMGHSQGGGAAWGVAQRQALKPVEGYLGSIAISPVTNVLKLSLNDNPLIQLMGAAMTLGIKSVYADFQPKDVFTEVGWEKFQMYKKLGAGISVMIQLLVGLPVTRDDWRSNEFVQKYVSMTFNGGK